MVVLTAAAGVTVAVLRGGEEPRPYRAFSHGSLWNTPLPPDVPPHPSSSRIVEAIGRDNRGGFLRLAGTGRDGRWGMPIYWAGADDPLVSVENSCDQPRPPQLDRVRIPAGARPDPTPDAAMTVYDRQRGVAVGLYHAEDRAGRWSACGGSIWYLASGGLDARVEGSDCTPQTVPPPGCRGHRGFPHPIHAVRLDEVRAGRIDHVLKISLTRTCGHVWPAAGDEGCDPGAPPEGTRLRIRPGVDLGGLDGPARVVARALQRYGAIVGDRGGGANLKVENCVAEGWGWCWRGVLRPDSLSSLPFTPEIWEVVHPDHGRDLD